MPGPLRRIYRSVKKRFTLREFSKRKLDELWKTNKGLRLLSRMSRHPSLLAIYYYITETFQVEQKVLFSGRIKYHQENLTADGYPLYLLRRNIHRIEKGISSKIRRQIFAQGYIQETVDVLGKVVTPKPEPSLRRAERVGSTIQWATDVLAEYFSVVGQTPEIDAARVVFEEIITSSGVQAGDKHPYSYTEISRSTITYQEILKLAMQRRSIRWYDQRPVPRELLDKAIRVARQSPSACNRQPFRFQIYDRPDQIQKISNLPGGATDFAENIPCLIVLVGEQRAYFSDRDLHLIYIDVSLAAMAFMFALETLGLASCCINWPNFDWIEKVAAEALGLASDERIVMLMAVGFPSQESTVACSAKKSLDEIRSYNRL